MGWLGWPPDVAMKADVNAIQIAMEGWYERERTLAGQPPEADKPAKASRSDWKEFVAAHNARHAAKKEREARDKARQEAAREKVKKRGR